MSLPRWIAEKVSRIMAAVATLNCDMPRALSISWAVSQITTTFISAVSVLCRMAHHRKRPSARCQRNTSIHNVTSPIEVAVPLIKEKGAMIRLKRGP